MNTEIDNRQLNLVFAALADPTRRAMLAALTKAAAPVADLARPFDMSAPAISRHLKVLERAGLIQREVRAQQRIISLNPQVLKQASDWVDQYRAFWDGSLDRLAKLLGSPDTPKKDSEK